MLAAALTSVMLIYIYKPSELKSPNSCAALTRFSCRARVKAGGTPVLPFLPTLRQSSWTWRMRRRRSLNGHSTIFASTCSNSTATGNPTNWISNFHKSEGMSGNLNLWLYPLHHLVTPQTERLLLCTLNNSSLSRNWKFWEIILFAMRRFLFLHNKQLKPSICH